MFSDLPCGLGINFAARQRGELIANIHHGVTAFALAIVDPEAEAHCAGFIPDLSDEAVSLVHAPRRLLIRLSDIFVRASRKVGQKMSFLVGAIATRALRDIRR
jgi:hypothetical protein